MRRRFVLLVLFLCCLAPDAMAGRIFGDIKLGGKPLAGVPVRISRVPDDAKAPQVLADSTVTDEFGSYKLTVKEAGKCELAVLFEKQTASLAVFSYKEPSRYDLILEKKDGKLTLRRK